MQVGHALQYWKVLDAHMDAVHRHLPSKRRVVQSLYLTKQTSSSWVLSLLLFLIWMTMSSSFTFFLRSLWPRQCSKILYMTWEVYMEHWYMWYDFISSLYPQKCTEYWTIYSLYDVIVFGHCYLGIGKRMVKKKDIRISVELRT